MSRAKDILAPWAWFFSFGVVGLLLMLWLLSFSVSRVQPLALPTREPTAEPPVVLEVTIAREDGGDVVVSAHEQAPPDLPQGDPGDTSPTSTPVTVAVRVSGTGDPSTGSGAVVTLSTPEPEVLDAEPTSTPFLVTTVVVPAPRPVVTPEPTAEEVMPIEEPEVVEAPEPSVIAEGLATQEPATEAMPMPTDPVPAATNIVPATVDIPQETPTATSVLPQPAQATPTPVPTSRPAPGPSQPTATPVPTPTPVPVPTAAPLLTPVPVPPPTVVPVAPTVAPAATAVDRGRPGPPGKPTDRPKARPSPVP